MFSEHRLPTLAGHSLNAAGDASQPSALLMHGVIRCWRDFGPVLPSLAFRAPLLALDHRGHGGSDRADRYLVVDYLADTVAVLRQLTAPVVLIGHSLGALVALGAAAAEPDRVRGVVLEDPPSADFLAKLGETSYHTQFQAMREVAGPGRDPGETARTLAEIRLPGGGRLGDRRDAAALRFLARCLRDLDPAVLTPLLECRWLEGFNPLEAARRLRCPALLLVADGAEGGMLPSRDADELAVTIPDVIRVDFPGVGHLIHAAQPARYLQLVINFLDSL